MYLLTQIGLDIAETEPFEACWYLPPGHKYRSDYVELVVILQRADVVVVLDDRASQAEL